MGEGQFLGHYLCKRASVVPIVEQLNTRQPREAAAPLPSPDMKLCCIFFLSNGSKFLLSDMTLQTSGCEQEISSKKLSGNKLAPRKATVKIVL